VEKLPQEFTPQFLKPPFFTLIYPKWAPPQLIFPRGFEIENHNSSCSWKKKGFPKNSKCLFPQPPQNFKFPNWAKKRTILTPGVVGPSSKEPPNPPKMGGSNPLN